MRTITMHSIRLLILPFCLSILPAQTPAELAEAQSGGVKLQSVELEEAALPNSQLKWLKIVCKFTTTKTWTDALSLNFEAIVRDPENSQGRLLVGGVSYVNIPKGSNTAIMYLTPNTLLRFGRPTFVSVSAFRGDLPIGETSTAGDRLKPDEKAALPRFDGALQNVRLTPWLIMDFGRTPDLAGAL